MPKTLAKTLEVALGEPPDLRRNSAQIRVLFLARKLSQVSLSAVTDRLHLQHDLLELALFYVECITVA